MNGRFAQQVNELAAVLRPAVAEESPEKLARFDSSCPGQPAARTMAKTRLRRVVAWPRRSAPFGGPGGLMADKPIKTFVVARAASVADQLAGKVEEPSNGPGVPRGPGGPGPGRFLADAFMRAFGATDGILTHDQFRQGFEASFTRWNADHSGFLTADQLRAGLGKDSPCLFPARRQKAEGRRGSAFLSSTAGMASSNASTQQPRQPRPWLRREIIQGLAISVTSRPDMEFATCAMRPGNSARSSTYPVAPKAPQAMDSKPLGFVRGEPFLGHRFHIRLA